MNKKRARRANPRSGGTNETARLRNIRHETANQPYGQHTITEKRQFVGVCALDILATLDVAIQEANGIDATAPSNVQLPEENQTDIDKAIAAFETTSVKAGVGEIKVSCMTCCNTVGVSVDSGEPIGQKMCQKYARTDLIQFTPGGFEYLS